MSEEEGPKPPAGFLLDASRGVFSDIDGRVLRWRSVGVPGAEVTPPTWSKAPYVVAFDGFTDSDD